MGEILIRNFTFSWLLLVFPLQVSASPLSINNYIKKNLLVNESFKIAELQKENAEEKVSWAGDLFQNTLILQPSFWARDFKSDSGFEFHEERPNLYSSMKQITPVGTTLGFESTYFYEDTNPAVGGTNSDLRFYIEQPLWQNSFGSQWRKQKKSAEHELDQMQLGFLNSLLEQCAKSAEDFISAYLSQQELVLLKQAYELAEQAKKIAQNGYNQRYLKKIDYLNSQSDFLKVKTELLKTQAQYDQRFNTLQIQSEAQFQGATLEEPKEFFASIAKPERIEKDLVLRLQALKASVESKKYSYLASKSENRTNANLGFETRKTRSLQPSNTGLLNAEQEIVQVYLRLELPLINKTQSAKVAIAFNDWQLSEFEKQRQEKIIEDQFSQQSIQFKNLSEQAKIAEENIKIRKLQLQEAIQLLRVGRIEFTDYIIYRDSLLNEEINYLRTLAQLWQTKGQLAQYDQTLVNKCKETAL